MNNLLLEKLDELTDDLECCPEIVEMLELKDKIYKDSNLSNLLNEYQELVKYDPKTISIKRKIISNPLITRYRKLEDELYLVVLEANKRLNTLVSKKGCNNENN